MTIALKKKILEHASKHRHSIRDLEHQAGLQSNAIHNILSDRSKNPTIDTVLKIADILGCSIDEMLGRKGFAHKSDGIGQADTAFDLCLFQSTCNYVMQFIELNNLEKLALSDIIYCIEEIYKYCLNTKSKIFEQNFAQWFLEQKLN
jgi:transcriptional regulator with XRE-family HTH domain